MCVHVCVTYHALVMQTRLCCYCCCCVCGCVVDAFDTVRIVIHTYVIQLHTEFENVAERDLHGHNR